MEHWFWQLRWRQGPVSIQDYKERDCSHGSVAFTHGNLDAPATSPRTGTERTPNSPRSLHGCGIMLFGYTQAVFAVLQLQRNRKDSSRINEGSVNRSRDREWGDWVKEKVKRKRNRRSEHMKSYPWNWQHIYLLSPALMLIWEKLHSEANGKMRNPKRRFTAGSGWTRDKKMSRTQSINTSQLITGG